jgi:hypothetical protein
MCSPLQNTKQRREYILPWKVFQREAFLNSLTPPPLSSPPPVQGTGGFPRQGTTIHCKLFFYTYISLVALHTLIQKPVSYSELPDRMSVIKLFLGRKKILFPVAESSGCSLFPEFPRISDNFQTLVEFSRNLEIGLWAFPRKKSC